MAGGYTVADDGEYGKLIRLITDMQKQIRELGRPTGGQFADQLERLDALYNDLAAEVAALAASGVTWAGPVSTAGSVTAGPVFSTDVYNFDVTTLPGARRTVSVHVGGRFGQTVSTVVKKTDAKPIPATASDFLACMPYIFHYIAQIDIRDNSENPNYDPSYEVPWDIGFMAEHLMANRCGLFVFYNDDGSPAGINYGEFGAAAAITVGRDHEARLQVLEGAAVTNR